MKIITEFHKLCSPRHDGSNPGAIDDWISCGDCPAAGNFYLLNSGNYDIADVITGNSSGVTDLIYFDSESECHATLAGYYAKHNEPYPYSAEWAVACIADTAEIQKDINESQVMEFV